MNCENQEPIYDRNLIYQNLSTYRRLAGFTQQMLAERMNAMGVPSSAQIISKMEHNRRCVMDYELGSICLILNVTPDDLMNRYDT